MSVSERVIQARILRPDDITEDEATNIVEVDLRVQQQITCPVSGSVLDSRTAVLLTHQGDGSATVVHPTVAEALGEIPDVVFFDPAPVLRRIGVSIPK